MKEKKLWFRAKRFGWGWYPVSWEGWGILLMYVFSVVSDFVHVDNHSHSGSDTLIGWSPHFFILTVFLIIICDARGEEAHWRWGKVDETTKNG